MKYDIKNTCKFFDEMAEDYEKNSYFLDKKYYPANYFRLKIIKDNISEYLLKGKILDAGCGTGILLSYLVKKGYECAGTDISLRMLKQARINAGKIPLVQTSLDDLSMFEDNYFDCVFCLGVFPYIPENRERKCYGELNRVIKSGGYLITAHSNEFFDLFTFNKYTIRFFERNFFPMLKKIDQKLNFGNFKNRLSSLIKNHDKPTNFNKKRSGRDLIFTKPENPLLYKDKIKKYDFNSLETFYYGFHCLPPLAMNGNNKLEKLSRKMETTLSCWIYAPFLASSFVNFARLDK